MYEILILDINNVAPTALVMFCDFISYHTAASTRLEFTTEVTEIHKAVFPAYFASPADGFYFCPLLGGARGGQSSNLHSCILKPIPPSLIVHRLFGFP